MRQVADAGHSVATGATVLVVLLCAGLVKIYPKPTLYGADIIGRLTRGVGIALAGICPGTVLAQTGVGNRDAIFTLLGSIGGAVAFGYAEPFLIPILLSGGPGKITFSDTTGLPYWILALALAAGLVIVLVGLEKWRPWQQEMGGDVEGDFGDTGDDGTAGIPSRHPHVAE